MSKYIIQELHDPNPGTPEFQAMYKRFAKRILWMDSNEVPGAFQMNTAWYFAVPEKDPVFTEHSHNNDEMIGFFGSNPDDPYDLGGEIDVTIDGETTKLTRTSLMFIPGGVPHMPLSIKRVDRPIFHFSVLMDEKYDGVGAYE